MNSWPPQSCTKRRQLVQANIAYSFSVEDWRRSPRYLGVFMRKSRHARSNCDFEAFAWLSELVC